MHKLRTQPHPKKTHPSFQTPAANSAICRPPILLTKWPQVWGGCSPNPLRLNDLVESLTELKKAPSSRFQVCCKGYRPGAVNGELHQGVGVPEVGCCVLRLPLHPACPQSSNLGGSPEPRCPLGFHYSGQFQGPLAVIGLCL